MKNVRFGVIGCGAIHGNHCDAIDWLDMTTLSAVYDVVPEKAQAAAEKYDTQAVASLEELWPLVDAVCVCVPSGLHAQIGIAAAKQGKHVLVEKPIDIQLQPALDFVTACEEAGVKSTCISQHRFAHDIREARSLALEGRLGKLIQGDAIIKWFRTQSYYDSGDWRGTWALDGGGCLMNQGVHYVDMIQWIMGGVRSVQAMTRTMAHDIEVEDTAMAFVEYHNGAVGLIQGSTCVYPGLAERVEVHGGHGTLVIEGDRMRVCEIDPAAAASGPYGHGVTMQPAPNVGVLDQPAAEAVDPSAQWGEQHLKQIEDFALAILNDGTPFITTREALKPLKIILSIYESARQGGVRIEVPR